MFKNRMRTNRRQSGFTLIELLVVVSIIALLISILLPSLARAREQAKLTVCQANMSGITKVMLIYLFDLDQLPIVVARDSATGELQGWTSWTYGGWSGRNREFWDGEDIGNVQTSERPLTVYALKGGSIASQEDIVPDGETAEFWPTEEAPIYKCPSDRLSAQWQWSNANHTSQLSAYDDVGTSYHMNMSAYFQISPNECPEGMDGDECFIYRTEVLFPKIWLGQMTRSGSRFMVIYEDPCDFGLNSPGLSGQGIQTMGFHGRFSRHTAAFLDGHVAYRFMDTRHLHDSKPNPPGPRHGPFNSVGSWTAIDEQRDHNPPGGGGRHGA